MSNGFDSIRDLNFSGKIRTVKRIVSDMCNSLLQLQFSDIHFCPRCILLLGPRERYIVVHCPGTGDSQQSISIQLPGQVIAAGTGCDSRHLRFPIIPLRYRIGRRKAAIRKLVPQLADVTCRAAPMLRFPVGGAF